MNKNGRSRKTPRVSVVMAVFNGEKYLSEAVDSILKQSFTDFEFIIINDGSTDNTKDILGKYHDERIVVIHFKKNMGIAKARNYGLEIAKGKDIAVMDSDDISLPNRLEMQVNFLDNHPDIGVVGSAFYRIIENGEILGKDSCLAESEDLKNALLKENQFCHGSTMIRRECFEKVGKYREEFKYSLDYDLWLRVSEHFKMTNIEEPLYMWRINFDGITVAKKVEQEKYTFLARRLAKERRTSGQDSLSHPYQKILEEDQKQLGTKYLKNKQLYHYYFQRGKALMMQGSLKEARQQYYYAVRHFPFYPRGWIYLFMTFLGKMITGKLRELRRYLIKKRKILF